MYTERIIHNATTSHHIMRFRRMKCLSVVTIHLKVLSSTFSIAVVVRNFRFCWQAASGTGTGRGWGCSSGSMRCGIGPWFQRNTGVESSTLDWEPWVCDWIQDLNSAQHSHGAIYTWKRKLGLSHNIYFSRTQCFMLDAIISELHIWYKPSLHDGLIWTGWLWEGWD